MTDDWAPRPDAFTVLVVVTADVDMTDWGDFQRWMERLRATIGAPERHSWGEPDPWTVSGWSPLNRYGQWRRDGMGTRIYDKTPQANVWQQGVGIPSLTMAYVWAALYLVNPLEQAGYSISQVWAGLTDDMVLIA